MQKEQSNGIMTLQEEAKTFNGFYVPEFEVLINGNAVPNYVLRDVIQISYKDTIKGLDSFDMTVNNWDTATNNLKYIEPDQAPPAKNGAVKPTASGEKKSPDKEQKVNLYKLFEPCANEVTIKMGYQGKLAVMLKGQFTSMEPTFPSGGAPTLTVRGLNILHKLRKKQNSRSWKSSKKKALKDTTIIKSLNKKGFPLPIFTPDDQERKEPKVVFLAQRSQYDIDFILSRANKRGYVVFLREEKDSDGNIVKKDLYFGPSDHETLLTRRPVVYKLEWGKSLIDFKPTLTTANQVRSVTVRGWIRSAKRKISKTVKIEELKGGCNQDLNDILMRCDAREEIVEDYPAHTEKEAEERAKAILCDSSKERVKASGTTVGLPDLRAGSKVIISGVGKRFSGTYFVTETTHAINDSGYRTKFKARREEKKKGSK